MGDARSGAQEDGFTLVELLVVVVILAMLAMLAKPVFSRDGEAERFNRFTHQLVTDILAAHHRAISSRDDYRLMVRGTAYQVEVIAGGVPAVVAERRAPVGVVVADIRAISSMPWDSGRAVPGGNDILGSAKELRFSGLGSVAVDVGAGLLDATATVFVRSEVSGLKARVVVFAATSRPHLITGW